MGGSCASPGSRLRLRKTPIRYGSTGLSAAGNVNLRMNQRTESSRPAAAGIAWGVLAILALAVSLFAFRIRECFVDNAFTGFQYIENLLAGHGFVFFPARGRSRG